MNEVEYVNSFYTHAAACVLSGMHLVIIGLCRVNGAFIRCIRRYYVARTPRNIHITAAWKRGFAGGQSQRWCTRLRTDRSLNCFVAPSRRNSPVFHFSSRSVQISTCISPRQFYIVHIPHITSYIGKSPFFLASLLTFMALKEMCDRYYVSFQVNWRI